MKLTDARLCEEFECLLGAREDIPLMVSLLLVLGLIFCRLVNRPVQKKKKPKTFYCLDPSEHMRNATTHEAR